MFFSWLNSPSGPRLPLLGSSITLGRTLLDQRLDPHLSTHNTHAKKSSSSGFRTRNPSKQAAVDPSLTPRSNWDRPLSVIAVDKYNHCTFVISGLKHVDWDSHSFQDRQKKRMAKRKYNEETKKEKVVEKGKTEKQQEEHYMKEGTGETRGSEKRKWKGEKRAELVPFLLTHSYRHADLSVSLQ
jgi:hypothetical protein